MRVGVAVLVPRDAGLGVVAVGRDLHRGPRAVLVEPAEAADELLLAAVAPEARACTARPNGRGTRPVSPDRDPLGPGVAEQAVGEQPELMRRGVTAWISRTRLAAEARLLERDRYSPGGRSTWTAPVARDRASNDPAPALELQQHVGQGDVALVTDITDEHDGSLWETGS